MYNSVNRNQMNRQLLFPSHEQCGVVWSKVQRIRVHCTLRKSTSFLVSSACPMDFRNLSNCCPVSGIAGQYLWFWFINNAIIFLIWYFLLLIFFVVLEVFQVAQAFEVDSYEPWLISLKALLVAWCDWPDLSWRHWRCAQFARVSVCLCKWCSRLLSRYLAFSGKICIF